MTRAVIQCLGTSSWRDDVFGAGWRVGQAGRVSPGPTAEQGLDSVDDFAILSP